MDFLRDFTVSQLNWCYCSVRALWVVRSGEYDPLPIWRQPVRKKVQAGSLVGYYWRPGTCVEILWAASDPWSAVQRKNLSSGGQSHQRVACAPTGLVTYKTPSGSTVAPIKKLVTAEAGSVILPKQSSR